jgi:hypothetical protein
MQHHPGGRHLLLEMQSVDFFLSGKPVLTAAEYSGGSGSYAAEGVLAAGTGGGHSARNLGRAKRTHDSGQSDTHAYYTQQHDGAANAVNIVSAAQCIANSALGWRHNDWPARGQRTRLNCRRAVGAGGIGGNHRNGRRDHRYTDDY